MKPITLITGATSGFGEAIARMLAKRNYPLILTGRRMERLQELEKELSRETGILIRCFDVRDAKACAETIENLPDTWKNIGILINNAGLAAGFGAIHNGNITDWEQMIDTNIKGALYMLRAVTPGMVERNAGHIVNMSSVASRDIYLNGNVYCATKSALDAITHSMRLELLPYAIRITSINPGMAETEFSLVRFHGDQTKANQVYENFEALSAEDVAQTVVYCLELPAHMNIQHMIVMPSAQAEPGKIRKLDGTVIR